MKIKFNDLTNQWHSIKNVVIDELTSILENGNYILGEPVKQFEKAFSEWNNSTFCVGTSNGTDALKLAFNSLQLSGSTNVYIPANTYIATLFGIIFGDLENSCKFVFVDCDEYFQIDVVSLENAIEQYGEKADNNLIVPVHLYGHSCNMKEIIKIAENYDCLIIEDCSQAHGTVAFDGKKVGTFGDVSAFSLYPGKNLGAAGDAGLVTTNNQEIYNRLLKLRNLGSVVKYDHEVIGWNARLDTIQACILTQKLKFLDEWNNKKQVVANAYSSNIKENDNIVLPKTSEYCEYNSYHIYPILVKNRESLQSFLHNKSIPTIIHYPIPLAKSKAINSNNQDEFVNTNRFSKELISLPIHPFLQEKEIDYIISAINEWVGNQ